MSRALRIALAQVSGEPYRSGANRDLALRTARRAFESGAQLVLLPELIISGYGADAERLRAIAEPLDGPSVTALHELAAEAGGYAAVGLCERDGDDLYNTAVLVGPQGVVLHYRKLHPFDREKLAFAPGDLGLPVAELPFGRVGLCVCYDLRFVETLRALALQGAELVCVPTAWVAGFDRPGRDATGTAPQVGGVIVQANLDQVFVACASQAGAHAGLEFLGSSLVAGPTGAVVVGPLSAGGEETAIAEIDLDEVRRAETRAELITPRADRRTDVYGLAVDGRVL